MALLPGLRILLQGRLSLLLQLLPARQQGPTNASRALATADGIRPVGIGTDRTTLFAIAVVRRNSTVALVPEDSWEHMS